MSVLSALGDSLTEGFFMFWETLWALVLAQPGQYLDAAQPGHWADKPASTSA